MKTILTILMILTVLRSEAQVSSRLAPGIHRGFRFKISSVVYTEIYPPDVLGMGLNEGSGTTISTSFGPSATMTGPMNWVTGASGSGWAIGTTGDESATTSSAAGFASAKITVTAWIKCANWSAAPGVIVQTSTYLGQPNGFRLYMTGDGNVFTAGMTGDTAASESQWQLADTLANGVWQHVACVFDGSVGGGGTMTFYLNGVLTAIAQGSSARDGTSNFADRTIQIGSSEGLNINIDDIRIYASALNAGQINAIYLNPR